MIQHALFTLFLPMLLVSYSNNIFTMEQNHSSDLLHSDAANDSVNRTPSDPDSIACISTSINSRPKKNNSAFLLRDRNPEEYVNNSIAHLVRISKNPETQLNSYSIRFSQRISERFESNLINLLDNLEEGEVELYLYNRSSNPEFRVDIQANIQDIETLLYVINTTPLG